MLNVARICNEFQATNTLVVHLNMMSNTANKIITNSWSSH